MAYPKYPELLKITDKGKKEIMLKVRDAFSNTDTSIEKILESCKITIWFINKWIMESEELMDIYQDGRYTRAIAYAERCRKLADEIDDFYYSTTETVTEDGRMLTTKTLRERTSAVNKARLRIDTYWKFAAMLNPEDFGDKSKEIKDAQKQMYEINKHLESILGDNPYRSFPSLKEKEKKLAQEFNKSK